MTLVKICGITHDDEVDMCAAAGADRLGFVVDYPEDVPWNLTRHEAARLMRRVPPGIARVAVVGGGAESILGILAATEPDMVQLHGDEDAETVARVAAAGVAVIKALRAHAGRPIGDAADWLAAARAFAAAGASELLLDSRTADRPAGTGARFDASIAAEVVRAIATPVILAGGLTPHNVAEAIANVRPAGVDVISGVEGPGHRKDPERVGAFVAAARSVAPR